MTPLFAAVGLVPAAVWRWLAIIGVSFAAAFTAYVWAYERGVNHQLALDVKAAEDSARVSAIFTKKQASDLAALAATYKAEAAQHDQETSDIRSGIAGILCLPDRAHASTGRARMPTVRSGTVEAPGAVSADTGDAGLADAPPDGLAEAIAHDAAGYGPVVRQLNALIQSANLAGASNP